jgi:RNA polymerase sigma-70 factor (ECF subfamily)
MERVLEVKQEKPVDWTALSDQEVALALKGGEDHAFDELVRRHQGRVYAVAYRLTTNREDALDIAQEAFLKAYRKVNFWQPTGGFLPWLLRLTTNQAIDFLRRRKRERKEQWDETVALATERAPVEPASMDAERRIRAQEIDARVRAGLVVLSETQRTVFVLRHYEGFSLADIAAELGCTVGSVKVHLFRALRKLQKELSDFI